MNSRAMALYARETAGFGARVVHAVALLRNAAVDRPDGIVQATSLCAEDMVITDLIGRLRCDSRAIRADQLDTEPAVVGRKYLVRHGNRWVQTRITAIESRLDIHTLEATDAHQLAANEIGMVVIETQQPLPIEACETNRTGGSLIVVEPASNRTSGALLVKAAL